MGCTSRARACGTMALKSAHMTPQLNPNFKSRYFQPEGFQENRSCVSHDSPSWFKPHPSIKTRMTPHNPDNNTNINLFLKVTADNLNPDGTRKNSHSSSSGPGGLEDTAVSEMAPPWFHVSHVPKVKTRVLSFFDPYDPALHEPTVGTTSSNDLPDWAHIKGVPKKPPRVTKAEKLWRHDYQKPDDTIRFDRDAATSKEAPDFFHIEGVPRAKPNPFGGYDFDYDHGAFGQKKKNFTQKPPVQINLKKRSEFGTKLPPTRAQSAKPRARSSTQKSGGARRLESRRVRSRLSSARREAETLKLREAIKQQKYENLKLLSEHIAHREALLRQQGQRSRPQTNHSRHRDTSLW